MLRTLLLATLLATPEGMHQNQPSVLFVGGDRGGWFLCDAVSGPIAAFVGSPSVDGIATISLLDRRTGRIIKRDYHVGSPVRDAGRVRWSLSRGGNRVGEIGGLVPGSVPGSEEGVALPPITRIAIGRTALSCRWLSEARYQGIGLDRSVVVTRAGGQFVYRSFDRDTLGPSLETGGGVVTNRASSTIPGGREVGYDFVFSKGGYTVYVRPFAVSNNAKGSVAVMHNGRAAGYTPLLGYAAMSDP